MARAALGAFILIAFFSLLSSPAAFAVPSALETIAACRHPAPPLLSNLFWSSSMDPYEAENALVFADNSLA